MNIAIIAPHPVPLVLGGAENLFWGLQAYIEGATPHSCEIVTLASPERNFWEVVDSYRAFSELNLDHFDCVISTKYPAWLVRHPNHRCYMQHTLRGLYDTYPRSLGGPESLDCRETKALVSDMYTRVRGNPDDIPWLFERLETLRDMSLPSAAFAFPGPLIREIVHFLDSAALSPSRMRTHAAISHRVREREDYFPPWVDVEVFHHPPHWDSFYCGGDDYLFTSSRLDGPKRIGLLIEAMRHVSMDIPLLIAGTGPEEDRLRELAGEDTRIRFLGYVEDKRMPDLYANALAVPFVPYDEDYGLVTIEAMRSAKPVITVSDAGGPCEFVQNGVTGYCTEANPEALGRALTEVCQNRPLARQMGEAARRLVAPITWERVVNGLLNEPAKRPARRRIRRRKLTVATTFPVYPPQGGGQLRIFHLYRHLADTFDVDVVSLGSLSDGTSARELAPGFTEIRVRPSEAHARFEGEMMRFMNGIPIGDIAASYLIELTPDYRNVLEASCRDSDAVVACHPYMIDELRVAAQGKPLWYEAQDVEFMLKQRIFSAVPGHEPLLERVREAEARCWREADIVFACVRADLDLLETVYGTSPAQKLEVPNGVCLEEIPFTDWVSRRALQERLGAAKQRTALFMASWHPPNIDAVERILSLAPKLPEIAFLVIGSVCHAFMERKWPDNVRMLGIVEPQVRNVLLASADVALNPMTLGSGTNLKMLDYFAAGTPVLSTPFGARGLEARNWEHLVLAETDELALRLEALLKLDCKRVSTMVQAARQLVEERYSWARIAANFVQALSNST